MLRMPCAQEFSGGTHVPLGFSSAPSHWQCEIGITKNDLLCCIWQYRVRSSAAGPGHLWAASGPGPQLRDGKSTLPSDFSIRHFTIYIRVISDCDGRANAKCGCSLSEWHGKQARKQDLQRIDIGNCMELPRLESFGSGGRDCEPLRRCTKVRPYPPCQKPAFFPRPQRVKEAPCLSFAPTPEGKVDFLKCAIEKAGAASIEQWKPYN